MEHLKNKFSALPLHLTLQAAFEHIFSNVTDVVDTREEYVKTHLVLLSLSFQASDEDGLSNYFKQVTKLLRRLEVLDTGKEYDSTMIVAQCQSMIRNSGISKRELRQIDKAWAKEDKGKPYEARFERFKKYYIAEIAIKAADEVQPTNNHANSAMQQKINELSESLVQMRQHNSVLMANQEEMASICKNSGVPAEITTNGGALVALGPDLVASVSQLLDDRTRSTKESSGSDTNQIVDPRKLQPDATWWRQFKFYYHLCRVNL